MLTEEEKQTKKELMERLGMYRYAHRGLHDKPVIPENSMAAFERALTDRFGAEVDVHLLRDGSLAVFHDSDLERCADVEGIIEDLDREKLKELRLEGTDEQIPLLDEVLELYEGKTPLIVELKPANGNYKELTRAVVKRLKSYTGDYCIESFDPRVLYELKKNAPEIVRGQLAQNFLRNAEGIPLWQRIILSKLLDNLFTSPDFVAFKYEDRDCAPIRRIRRHGIQEVNWTIRNEEDMLAAEALGNWVIFEKFIPSGVKQRKKKTD